MDKSGGGNQDIPSKIFCLTEPKISVEESFTVALISGIEKVWISGGKEVSRISIENILSHSAENFRRGTLYSCINFGYRKSLEKSGGGRESRYSVEKFLSHSAENFRRRILFCCIIFGYRKSLDKRGEGRIKILHRKFFVSVPKISVGKSFSDSLISGTENVWRRGGGGIKILRQSFFVSQCRKFPYGNHLLLH